MQFERGREAEAEGREPVEEGGNNEEIGIIEEDRDPGDNVTLLTDQVDEDFFN